MSARRKHLERMTVHLQHADFADAAFDEFRVHVGEDAKVVDAEIADLVEQHLDAGKVLDP